MADACSFDIVSDIDMQEVDNAVNQAAREIKLRYDFKNSKSSFTFNRAEKKITILADDAMKLRSMHDILKAKAVKRGIALKALQFGKEEKAFGETIRQEVTLQVGIAQDNAKKIVKDIKELKTKVQASIQGDQVRVSGKKIDDLQEVIRVLKEKEYDFALQFVNYRR